MSADDKAAFGQKLTYGGPLDGPHTQAAEQKSWFRQLPLPFLVVVVLPTIMAAIYLFLIVTPRYVSEARFVVRTAAGTATPSALGAALQGVGLSAGSTNAFAVHEYIMSRQATLELDAAMDLKKIYDGPGVDAFSRLEGPFGGSTHEAIYKGLSRYVKVGYDSTNGISTLRVQAFSANDAQRINQALLRGGERVVNSLNQRSAADSVRDAGLAVEEAQARLSRAQVQLTDFRTRERFIDPTRSAQAGGELIGNLAAQLAVLKAERAQIASETPASPQLPVLDSRIQAFQRQIDIEQTKIVGDADSLAPKIGAYETLMLEREFADRLVMSTTATLNAAQVEAQRQQLYLDLIVSPDKPDEALEPQRWKNLLAIFCSLLLVYGIGWLVVASVRESRADR